MRQFYASVIAAFACTISAAMAATPSFDCGKAESSAEKLVCQDEQLSELDREVARLYELALDGPHMTADRRSELKAYQRGWIKGRDDCWKAEDLRNCVLDEYVLRIFQLRQGYADARTEDDKGISLGPFVAECPGLDAAIAVAFISTQPPPLAYLQWRDNSLVMAQGPSGSGARYLAEKDGGEYVFWNKGNKATFSRPDSPDLECSLSEGG